MRLSLTTEGCSQNFSAATDPGSTRLARYVAHNQVLFCSPGCCPCSALQVHVFRYVRAGAIICHERARACLRHATSRQEFNSCLVGRLAGTSLLFRGLHWLSTPHITRQRSGMIPRVCSFLLNRLQQWFLFSSERATGMPSVMPRGGSVRRGHCRRLSPPAMSLRSQKFMFYA